MIRATLVIAYYNNLEYMKIVLDSVERQSFKDFEVIIADDGSTTEYINGLEKLLKTYSFPALHLWHEDKGFRKNRIYNRAIMAAQSEYLIFIDGDCFLHREFIKEHYYNRHKNVCLTGRRVNLSQKLTDKKKLGKDLSFFDLAIDGIAGKSIDVEKGLYFKSKFLREVFNKKERGILGCNFSIHKEDMLRINGFDERYEAPSIGEDSDIQFRMELIGIKIKSFNNIAVQYHLYHKLQERLQVNLDIFDEVKRERIAFTKFGIVRGE